jgi:hypothetical protein
LYSRANPIRFIDPNGEKEREGWQAGTVDNQSSQTIYVATDRDGETLVFPLDKGELSKDFVEDADAIVIGRGLKIDGMTEGAFKLGAGDVVIKDGPNGTLTIGGDFDLTLLLSYAAGKAGMVDVETARQENWILPVDEQVAREVKEQLQSDAAPRSQEQK